jgi:hypothetical protein
MIIELGVIAGIIIIVLAIFWLGWLAKGMHDDRKQYLAELREAEKRPEPRHAVTQPRIRQRKGSAGLPHIETLDYQPFGRKPSPRLATTATDIAPVILPAPGTHIPQPAPGLTGAADTGTMYQLSVTGEIAKLTDENMAYIERMRLEEAQHRATLELTP